MIEIVMDGVREYCEEYNVSLIVSDNGREVIQALNEAGYNSTQVDLLDLIVWLRQHRPALLVSPGTIQQ